MSSTLLFGKFGNSVSDLFKDDKFPVDANTVKFTTKSSNGLGWTYTSKLAKAVTSDLQLKYKSKDFGSTEIKSGTSGDITAKLNLDKFFKGAVFKIEAEDSKKKPQQLGLVAEYRQDAFSASASVDNKKVIKASAVISADGLSVGGSADASFASEFKLTDFNAGVQYEQADLTAAIVTSDSTNAVALTVNHVISQEVTFATEGKYSFKDGSKSLTVGGKIALDKETVIKGKLQNSGDLSASFEHQLRSYAKLSLFSKFNVSSGGPTFGATLALGDSDE